MTPDMPPPRPPMHQVDTFEEARSHLRATARPVSGKPFRKAATMVQTQDGSLVDLTQSNEVTIDRLKGVLDRTKSAAKTSAAAAREAREAARENVKERA